MKFGIFTVVFSLTIYVATAAHGNHKMEFLNGNFKVQWLYNETSDNLTFYLEVKTVGWVGFGFGLKAPNGMKDYDVVVGGVTGAGVNYLNDYYTGGTQKPPQDQSQDYTLLNASESGGWTNISFTRKSNTGDDKDVQIMAGKPVHLIYAYKNVEDAIGSGFKYHDHRGHSEMVVLIPAQMASPSPTLMTMMSTPVPTTSTTTAMTYTNSLSMDNGNVKINWNYDKTKGEYLFYLKVKATGWVAMGFANEAPNNMEDYDVAIGGVNANGTAYINDYFTNGHNRPPLDSKQNFELMKGKENGGYTEIWFKRKADTMDAEKDLKLTAGTEVFIVWAYRSNIDAEDPASFPIHSKRGFSKKKMDLSKTKANGGVSLATFSFGVILTNLLIAVRCIL